jgi:hypothetical protein
MAALAHDDTYMAWGSVPTGGFYRVPVTDETAVEPIPGLDADALIGRLRGEASEATEVTLRREQSIGLKPGRVATVGALLGAGLMLMGSPAIFEPTPFTLDVAHHADARAAGPTPADDDATRTEPAAYRAFKDLARWLDAEDGQVADMVGIGRTTPYTWSREGREPRAATAQRIYEHHATLDALLRRLGLAGLRRWLHEGIPTRRDTLLAGDLAGLERDVHEVLFRRSVEHHADLAAAPEGTAAAVDPTNAAPVRPSGRRPRRPAT